MGRLNDGQKLEQEIFVVKDLHKSLLGQPAFRLVQQDGGVQVNWIPSSSYQVSLQV